jgi:hypothetical protein
MDVQALQEMELASKASRKVLRLGTKTKEIVWRRRGLMQPEVQGVSGVALLGSVGGFRILK